MHLLGNGIIYEVMNGAVKLPFPPLASLSSISFLVILRQDVVPGSLQNQGYDLLLVSKIEIVDIGGRALC